LAQAIPTPGNAITTVSRELGEGVSKVLTAVGSQLPEQPAVTQDQLEQRQRAFGEDLAAVRDGITAGGFRA